MQRFGSALQLTPHCHAWVPDGVFTREATFVPLPPPSQEKVERLLERTRHRVLALLALRGVREAEAGDDALEGYRAHSLRGQLALLQLDVRAPPRQQPRCAFLEGFSLHANTHLHANDRGGLERLGREVRIVERAPRRAGGWASGGSSRCPRRVGPSAIALASAPRKVRAAVLDPRASREYGGFG